MSVFAMRSPKHQIQRRARAAAAEKLPGFSRNVGQELRLFSVCGRTDQLSSLCRRRLLWIHPRAVVACDGRCRQIFRDTMGTLHRAIAHDRIPRQIVA